MQRHEIEQKVSSITAEMVDLDLLSRLDLVMKKYLYTCIICFFVVQIKFDVFRSDFKKRFWSQLPSLHKNRDEPKIMGWGVGVWDLHVDEWTEQLTTC